MMNLWKGEVISKRFPPQEQGDYASEKYLSDTASTSSSYEHVSNILESESFQLLHDNRIQDETLLQPLKSEHSEKTCGATTLPGLEHYRLNQEEMASIAGNYQHERNENLDEYFKAVGMFKVATNYKCGIPYDGSKNKYDL